MMTPNELDVLLHYHTTPRHHPRIAAPAVRDAIAKLLGLGLLTDIEPPYTTTSRGAAHVKQLCWLPIPEQAWIGADGKVVQND